MFLLVWRAATYKPRKPGPHKPMTAQAKKALSRYADAKREAKKQKTEQEAGNMTAQATQNAATQGAATHSAAAERLSAGINSDATAFREMLAEVLVARVKAKLQAEQGTCSNAPTTQCAATQSAAPRNTAGGTDSHATATESGAARSAGMGNNARAAITATTAITVLASQQQNATAALTATSVPPSLPQAVASARVVIQPPHSRMCCTNPGFSTQNHTHTHGAHVSPCTDRNLCVHKLLLFVE